MSFLNVSGPTRSCSQNMNIIGITLSILRKVQLLQVRQTPFPGIICDISITYGGATLNTNSSLDPMRVFIQRLECYQMM